MRRITVILTIALLSLVLGSGPAAQAQTASTLPGVPAGQGGPDNGVNASQGGNAPGGAVNPATNAGPVTPTDDGGSLAPWMVGAGVLVLLAVAGALVARKVAASRSSAPAGRHTRV